MKIFSVATSFMGIPGENEHQRFRLIDINFCLLLSKLVFS